jgi:HlyD family secretion protein
LQKVSMLDAPRHEGDETWLNRCADRLRSFKIPPAWETRLHAAAAQIWRWRLRAPMLVGALAVLWYFGAPILLGPIVSADLVARGDFVQSVVASGHVEAPYRVNIGSQITGVVVSVPVSEGQSVGAGDTLIVLDDHEAQASVVQAEGAVAQTEPACARCAS